MKRNFVFVWSPEVQPAIAALSAPKIAQLRAWCNRLIARAEQERSNTQQRADEARHGCDEESPWAPFQKFGYWFKLEFQEEPRAYVLNFATPPAGQEVADQPKSRRVRARKSAKSGDERLGMWSAWRALRPAAKACFARVRLQVCRSAQLFVWWSLRQANYVRNTIGGLCDMPLRMTRRMSSEPGGVAARVSRGPEGVLEPRLLGQNTGIAMLIYTLVWDDETIDWSADLFGAPESERS